MTKKLYIVSVGFEYACLADDEHDALRFKEEALHDEGEPSAVAKLAVTGPVPYRPRGWTDDVLIYGAPRGIDLRLDAAIAAEKNRVEQENRDAELSERQLWLSVDASKDEDLK
jgi:hypothetical protein